MPRISRASIERLRASVNIYDVVAPTVRLTRAGKSWKGLSPFSQEKTPSFYVHPERGFFKCFSTGTGGDAIRFVEIQERLSFQEAVEILAERFNVPLEYEDGGSGPSPGERSLRRDLLDLHDYAAAWYAERFWADSAEAGTVRTYWTEQRGFSPELARELKIGLAPPIEGGLIDHLRRRFSVEALTACGLFYFREGDRDGRTLRPRFRGRLMIPIRDPQGQVVAFTARQLELTPEDDPTREAKYVNSPETPIFHKGRLVFGLDRARPALDAQPEGTRRLLMVEGQLDAIRCWSVGVGETIAPQGTAVTEEQLRLIRRHADRLDCLLDGDSAGQRAALRLLPMAWKAGLEVRFLVLPPGQDPDTLLRSQGADAVAALEENALGPVAFALNSLGARADLGVNERARVLQGFFELLTELDSATIQEGFLAEAVRILRVDRRAAEADFRQFSERRRRPQWTPPAEAPELESEAAHLTTAEDTLLYALLHHSDLVGEVAVRVNLEWVDFNRSTGCLLRRLLLRAQEGDWDEEGAAAVDALAETPEERAAAFDLLTSDLGWEEPRKETNQALRAIHERHHRQTLARLESQLSRLPDGDPGIPAVQREILAVRRRRKQPSLLS